MFVISLRCVDRGLCRELKREKPPRNTKPDDSNQAIRTRLENGLDAGRFRGKFRVIPRYSAAESSAECAELRFRPSVHPRPRYSAFGRADSACHRIPRLDALDATRVRIAWLTAKAAVKQQ